MFGEVAGPKYDGKYIRSLTKTLLRNMTIKQTLTDIVIPAFDIKHLQPTIFSTAQVSYITTQFIELIFVRVWNFNDNEFQFDSFRQKKLPGKMRN